MATEQEIKDKISETNKLIEIANQALIEAEKNYKIKQLELRKLKNKMNELRIELEEIELQDFENKKKNKEMKKANQMFQKKYLNFMEEGFDEAKEYANSYVKSRGLY